MIRKMIFGIVRAVFSFYFFTIKGLKCEGAENIPAEGAVIIAPNHKSNFDPPAIGVCSPRVIHYMAKEELFKYTLVGAALRYFGTFPVKRGSIDRAAIRQAVKELKNGEPLGIFPEGTRIRGSGIGRFHDGMASLALMTGTPILPVAVVGTEKLPKKEGPLAVIFGKPIPVEKGRATDERMQAVNDQVRKALIDLRDEYCRRAGLSRDQ